MALVKALIADADVVINNFRAGVMERLGLGYEDCRRINPRIIYAVGTGFGETGPYAHKGGQDVLAQALTGVMARRADDVGAAVDLPDRAGRLHRRHAHGAGHPAGAAAARAHRRGPEGHGVALQLDAGHADAGSGHDHDGRLGGQLGRDAAVGRVRDAGRRAGAGRRVQGQSAARHLHRARPARPVARRALRNPERSSSSTRPSCSDCSASASRATRATTGWRGSRSRTCSRRRCATCARRWSIRRRCTTT